MIVQLASPSVCVIDDEEDEYRQIISALNKLYVSSIHILGNDSEQLPESPFTRLQLVFLDLCLTSSLGKDAASHTANVFRRVVSANTAPVVVVIWSKHADEITSPADVPEEDQETQSDLFKKALFDAEPRFKNRLIFLEMAKPKEQDRPGDWSTHLQGQINGLLNNQSAIGLLWTWDGLVKDANAGLMASLTDLAEESAGDADPELTDADVKEVLQRLTKAQSEGDLTAENASESLVAILSELLADQLEHGGAEQALSVHGEWLVQAPGDKTKASVAAKMNGFLLAADPADTVPPYMLGIVYRATDNTEFCRLFGITMEILETLFCKVKRQDNAARVNEWNAAIRPVVIEISPVCDVANKKRYHALLIGGLVVPAAKQADLFKPKDPDTSPLFSLDNRPTLGLRRPLEGFNTDGILLVLCHRMRASAKVDLMPPWLVPWFRLRELPTTSLRNRHMAYASRVGIVSVA
jgi:hypothetical protein